MNMHELHSPVGSSHSLLFIDEGVFEICEVKDWDLTAYLTLTLMKGNPSFLEMDFFPS